MRHSSGYNKGLLEKHWWHVQSSVRRGPIGPQEARSLCEHGSSERDSGKCGSSEHAKI